MEKHNISELYTLKSKKIRLKRNPAEKSTAIKESDKNESRRNTAALNDKNLGQFEQPFDWQFARSTFRRK